jgi:hypothetical protein
VLEFDQFLSLAGCSRNRHLFVGSREKVGLSFGLSRSSGPRQPIEENLALRTDHYQTPTQVIVSIFGKGADKQASSITFDHWEVRSAGLARRFA